MGHAWETSRPLNLQPLGPSAILIIRVPIPRVGEDKTLRDREPESRDIAYPDEHSGKLLPASDDSKLCGLFDCIDGVGTTVSKTDDLGLGRLGLQQERREVGSIEWMSNLADNSTPVGLDCRCRVAFRRLPKRVINSYEEPGIAARLHHGFASAMRV